MISASPINNVTKTEPEPWNSSSSESRFLDEFLRFWMNAREWVVANAALLSLGLGLTGVTLVGATWFEFQKTLAQASPELALLEPSIAILPAAIPSSASSKIRAHIAGAVRKPGVYELSSSSVVQDLVTLAGGLSGLVWQDYLDEYINLAAPVEPNQKIWIPSVVQRELLESALAPVASAELTEASENQSNPTTSTTSLISINTATVTELDTLAGIGQKRAEDIVVHRPYSSIEELTTKAGVPASIVSKLQNQLQL